MTEALLADGVRTFFGVPAMSELDELDVDAAFVGVPFDAGTPEHLVGSRWPISATC